MKCKIQSRIDIIQQLCKEGHMNLSELFKKSLALMMLTIENIKKGNHLMIVNQKNEPVSEIKEL